MHPENIILAAIGLVSGGGLLKFFQWFTRNNESVAAGWRKVAESLESRMTRMEIAYTERIQELEDLIDRRERLYLETLGKKDLEIITLREEVGKLRHEVANLRATQQIDRDVKKLEVEHVKTELHEKVDHEVDKLKP